MHKAGWWVAVLLLVSWAAQAQVPDLLPGRWEVVQLGFVAEAEVPDSVRDRLNDPQVAELNIAIMSGEAHLVVEFRPDGTYEFGIMRAGEQMRRETGTYTLEKSQLLARSAAADGSSFHNQHLTRLTRRTLVLAFPVGSQLPGVVEEIEYRRLK